MLELLQKNRKIGLLAFLLASQMAGGIIWITSLINQLDHNTIVIEELEQKIELIGNKLNAQIFTINRLSFQNQFQNDAVSEKNEFLETQIRDVSDDLTSLERSLMSR